MPEMTTRFNMVRRELLRIKHRGGVFICQLDSQGGRTLFSQCDNASRVDCTYLYGPRESCAQVEELALLITSRKASERRSYLITVCG